MDIEDPCNTIKFISGGPIDATNYEVVFTLTGVDANVASALKQKLNDYFLQNTVDLKAPINTVKVVDQYGEESELVGSGVAKQTTPFLIVPLTDRSASYATLVN